MKKILYISLLLMLGLLAQQLQAHPNPATTGDGDGDEFVEKVSKRLAELKAYNEANIARGEAHKNVYVLDLRELDNDGDNIYDLTGSFEGSTELNTELAPYNSPNKSRLALITQTFLPNEEQLLANSSKMDELTSEVFRKNKFGEEDILMHINIAYLGSGENLKKQESIFISSGKAHDPSVVEQINSINSELPIKEKALEAVKIMVEEASNSSFAAAFFFELESLFSDNNKISISDNLQSDCGNLFTNLQKEFEKVSNVPASLDTRILISDLYNEEDLLNGQQYFEEQILLSNVRYFVVFVDDNSVRGILYRREADKLLNIEKYYNIEREIKPGENKCSILENLIKDFLNDYGEAIHAYYNDLNSYFPNKLCNSISLNLSGGNNISSTGGGNLEDFAGLPDNVTSEITDYLSEFDEAFNRSIKVYFTSSESISDNYNIEGTSEIIFETLKNKFENKEFDEASYAIWFHYDDNSGCLYLQHGLNESKVFQEANKSELSKSSDKQEIIAEANKVINDLISELNGKGADGWNVLASNFRNIYKATIGGIANVYDMGRETYETGKTPVRLWDDTKVNQYEASPFHDITDGIACGGGDAIIDKVTEIPQLVSFAYDLATKEEVQTQIKNLILEVTFEKIWNAAANFFYNKKEKYQAGGNVMRHEASLDVSTVFLEFAVGNKIWDLLKDFLQKLSKETREAVIKVVKEKFTDPEQIRKFILDIDADDVLLKKIVSEPHLVDSWKVIEGNPILRKKPENLENISKWLDEGIEPQKLTDGIAKSSSKQNLIDQLGTAKSKLHAQVLIKDYDNIPGVAKGRYTPNGSSLSDKVKMPSDWPSNVDIPDGLLDRFTGKVEPFELKPGDKIYRVSGKGGAAGAYWTRTKPEGIKDVIGGTAVQPKWNDLEYLYEYTIPNGKSIKTWKGSTARQPVGDVPSNYHLEGGEEQLFISYIEKQDSGFLNTVKTNKTNWLTQD